MEFLDKPGKTLRIALVFPPAMPPASPPLGIAALKPYLESAANVEVRNFDLNLAYFEQAFRWLDDGRLRMRLRNMDFRETAEKLAAARDFFLGRQGIDRFFDLVSYNEHAGTYAGFCSVLNGLFDNFARKIILGLPAPPLVNAFFEELIAPLKAFQPGMIGFSILFSQQLFFALALSKLCGEPPQPGCALAKSLRGGVSPLTDCALAKSPRVKEGGESPQAFGVKTVFGGATFSVMPDPGRLLAGPIPVYLGAEPREADISRLIDYLIVGEGERGMEALAKFQVSGDGEAASGSDQLCSVPGLIHMRDGKRFTNPAEAPLGLNELPLPDFSDFNLQKYHSPIPVLPYLSSRGCPWRRCAFCTHQKTYLDYREEDTSITAGRLSALHEKYNVSHFCLVDEMVRPRRLERIATDLLTGGVQIHFSAYAKPSGFSPRLLENAHRAGLRLLMWGLESASQRLLDLMCKGTNSKEIGTILSSARKAGVWNLLFVILGFPTETRAEWLSTLDFLESNQESVHALSRSRFILVEGSDVFSNPQLYGIKRVIDRPRRDPVSIAYDYEVTEGLTPEEGAVMFEQSLARLSGIGASPWFGQFREHMLLYASEFSDQWLD